MSIRDLTKTFLWYRSQQDHTADFSAHNEYERDSSKDRLTNNEHTNDIENGLDQFENDGAGHRQWMDYRDAANNNFYEIESTLKKLREIHDNALGFEQQQYRTVNEQMTARVTSLLRDTNKSVKRIFVPELLSEDPQENAIRKNVQMELSQKLHHLTKSFRDSQKECVLL